MGSNTEVGTVRSVERALAIIELLGKHQALGLEELHYLTHLPKATVSRMLLTLEAQGWIYRSLSDRRYHLRARSMFGDTQQRFKRQMVENAAPWLLELSEHTGLVVDLSSFDGERLEVMESVIPRALRKFYPNNFQLVGQYASLFHSAMGKICLAQLSCDEVQRLAACHHLPKEEQHLACEQSLRQGFGQRTEGYWEYPMRLPFLIRAVALPVRANGRLVGSIALHWPMGRAPVERMVGLYMVNLESTVQNLQRLCGERGYPAQEAVPA